MVLHWDILRQGGFGKRKKSRIGRKCEEHTVVVDLSIHISKYDESIISDSDAYRDGGEHMGGVLNVISRGILPD